MVSGGVGGGLGSWQWYKQTISTETKRRVVAPERYRSLEIDEFITGYGLKKKKGI